MDYARSERIAIKMDSHISEADAISQTDAELKSHKVPESVEKAQALREKMKLDHAEREAAKARRYNYAD
jgi:hypothetical protein